MYKLSEVAKKLNVEKVLLFELIITKGNYLQGNITKKSGVTYISEDGINIIDKIIRGEDVNIPEEIIRESENSIVVKESSNLESDLDKAALEIKNISHDNHEKNKSEYDEKNSDLNIDNRKFDYKIETDNISENDEVKNLEILTGKSKFLKFEKEEKRNKISKLRNEFIHLDSEIRKKQDALESYDKILEEDIQWVCILEDKLSVKLKEKLRDDNETSKKKRVDKIFFKK